MSFKGSSDLDLYNSQVVGGFSAPQNKQMQLIQQQSSKLKSSAQPSHMRNATMQIPSAKTGQRFDGHHQKNLTMNMMNMAQYGPSQGMMQNSPESNQ